MYLVEYDRARGIVRCTSSGFFTVEDVLAQRKATHIETERCRRDFGYVKILSASLDSQVQSAAVMEEAALGRWRRVDPRDRLALVVSSQLFKMQISRTFQSDAEKAFLSEAEALAWLMADSTVVPVSDKPAVSSQS